MNTVAMSFLRLAVPAALVVALFSPAPAYAQSGEDWRVDFVPLYFWANSLSGNFSAGPATLPIALDFSKAKDNLGGAFSFHLEVSKGRWGTFADLNFIRNERRFIVTEPVPVIGTEYFHFREFRVFPSALSAFSLLFCL
jgi:hypothetical protein